MSGWCKGGKGIPPEGSLANPTCARPSSAHNASRVRKQNTAHQGSEPVMTMVGFKLWLQQEWNWTEHQELQCMRKMMWWIPSVGDESQQQFSPKLWLICGAPGWHHHAKSEPQKTWFWSHLEDPLISFDSHPLSLFIGPPLTLGLLCCHCAY